MRLAVDESSTILLGCCPVVELDVRVLLISPGSTSERGGLAFNSPTGR
jgi:hypothetical protein